MIPNQNISSIELPSTIFYIIVIVCDVILFPSNLNVSKTPYIILFFFIGNNNYGLCSNKIATNFREYDGNGYYSDNKLRS